jgi:hypothetical protein
MGLIGATCTGLPRWLMPERTDDSPDAGLNTVNSPRSVYVRLPSGPSMYGRSLILKPKLESNLSHYRFLGYFGLFWAVFFCFSASIRQLKPLRWGTQPLHLRLQQLPFDGFCPIFEVSSAESERGQPGFNLQHPTSKVMASPGLRESSFRDMMPCSYTLTQNSTKPGCSGAS